MTNLKKTKNLTIKDWEALANYRFSVDHNEPSHIQYTYLCRWTEERWEFCVYKKDDYVLNGVLVMHCKECPIYIIEGLECRNAIGLRAIILDAEEAAFTDYLAVIIYINQIGE